MDGISKTWNSNLKTCFILGVKHESNGAYLFHKWQALPLPPFAYEKGKENQLREQQNNKTTAEVTSTSSAIQRTLRIVVCGKT